MNWTPDRAKEGPTPIFISPEEVSRVLGRGRTHIHELIGSGKLQSVKSGRRRLVLYRSVVEYAEGLVAAEAQSAAA